MSHHPILLPVEYMDDDVPLNVRVPSGDVSSLPLDVDDQQRL